jgi:histidyl-tRNA synthetase
MISPIKGTHDFLDLTLYNFIVDAARTHLHKSAFIEIATPILEPTELFKRTLGTHTDVVSKEMFTVDPHPQSSERICLRPEATASTTRAYLNHGIQEQPWKVFSSGPMFRYERPQKGRFRQFHQFNIEVIDAESIAYDAQVVAELNNLFSEKLKLSNYALLINFLGCPQDRAEYRVKLKQFLSEHKDSICETCTLRADSNSMRVFDCKTESCQALYQHAPFIADHLCETCSQEWQQLQTQLHLLSISFAYNPKLVRGLDYYNKTVFEFVSSDLGAQSAFCGGGRYELAQQLGAKKPVPSIGAAFGIERVILMLEASPNNRTLPEKPALFVIMPLAPEQQGLALLCADLLLAHNFCVDTLLDGGSIKQMMRKANKVGASYALLIGSEEQQKHEVTVKNMITGEQVTVKQHELVNYFKK